MSRRAGPGGGTIAAMPRRPSSPPALARGGLGLLAALLGLACADGPPSASGETSGGGEGSCGLRPDEVVLQEACPLDRRCPTVARQGDPRCPGHLDRGDPYLDEDRCVLEFLSLGQPGEVLVEGACEGEVERLTIAVVGPGEAIVTSERRTPCDACGCPEGERAWAPLVACELVDLASFTACLEASDPEARASCLTPETWFIGCEGSSPRCAP